MSTFPHNVYPKFGQIWRNVLTTPKLLLCGINRFSDFSDTLRTLVGRDVPKEVLSARSARRNYEELRWHRVSKVAHVPRERWFHGEPLGRLRT